MALPARRHLPAQPDAALQAASTSQSPAVIDRLPVKAPGDPSHPGGILEVYSNRIIAARKRKGYTQLELAYRSGITPTQISRIENARGWPRLDTVERIAFALEVDVAWLIAGKGGNYVNPSEWS